MPNPTCTHGYVHTKYSICFVEDNTVYTTNL